LRNAPLAELTFRTEGVWTRHTLPLRRGSYKLVFEAQIQKPSYVAIDDVEVRAGPCSTTCPSDSFRCGDSTCISKLYKCDGVAHCGDSSDETNCPQPDLIDCSFESPFACGFRQEDSDTFNWAAQYGLASGPLPSSGAGEDDAAFLVARPPARFEYSQTYWPLSIKERSCLTMHYFMFGGGVGSLKVTDENGVSLWEEWGDQGLDWQQTSFEIISGGIQFTAQSAGEVRYAVIAQFKANHVNEKNQLQI